MKPELLAPAPTLQHLKAAAAAGCDAVYFGAGRFNARKNAGQVEAEQISEYIRYAHERNVRVYLALNTIISDREIEDALKLAAEVSLAGADAFIVQDDGLLSLLKKSLPGMEFHSSTQRTVADLDGVNYALQLGYSQIVLARELSFEEIKKIRKNTDARLEIFVHGALCYSVSGLCYMSSVIGQRSGNRGLCAQPCRLPYSVAGLSGKAEYPLSYKELSLIDHTDEIKSAGIDSLKIEGRMRSVDYVYAVTSVYRKALDGISITEQDRRTLRSAYSRDGFTDGYFTGKTGRGMLGVRDKDTTPPAVKFEEKKKTAGYCFDKIDFSLETGENEPIRLTALCRGKSVTVTGATAAAGNSVTFETAARQLSKLGGTGYEMGSLEYKPMENLYFPVSEINRLRREAVAAIDEIRARDALDYKICWPESAEKVELKNQLRFFRLGQIDTGRENLKDYKIWLPLSEITAHENEISELVRAGWDIGAELGRVTFERDSERETAEISSAARICKSVLIGNRSQILKAQRLGYELYGSFSLNVFNSFALEELSAFKAVVMSAEISQRQLRELRGRVPAGYFKYGYLPVMTTAGCVRKNTQGCRKCSSGQSLAITDRKGVKFETFRENNDSCISTLLNSVPVYNADYEANTDAFGFFYFTTESKSECSRIIEMAEKRQPPDFKFTRGLFKKGVL